MMIVQVGLPSKHAQLTAPCGKRSGSFVAVPARLVHESQGRAVQQCIRLSETHKNRCKPAGVARSVTGAVARQPHPELRWPGVADARAKAQAVGPLLAVLCVFGAALPGPVHATEILPTELFHAFLDEVEALGSLGPVLFVATVVLAELIPLFPTQPLALASGLLFGGKEGALFVLLGSTLAALLSFSLARGVGKEWAKGVVEREADGKGEGPIKSKMKAVTDAIENGGFWQQLTAITFLRLTPVVPYTASNYLLGVTPLRLPAFLGGTVAGMAVWSALYASLGGAGRALLRRGANVDTLLADMAEKAAGYSEEAGLVALGVGGLGAAGWGLRRYLQQDAQRDSW